MCVCVCTIYTRPLSVQVWHSRSCPNLCTSCCNGCLVNRTVARLTASKLKPFMFLVSSFTSADVVIICISMILCDIYMLPAKFRYVIINNGTRKAMCNSRAGVHLGNLSMVQRTTFCKEVSRRGKHKLLLIYLVLYGVLPVGSLYVTSARTT
jgi:hypothetical protein